MLCVRTRCALEGSVFITPSSFRISAPNEFAIQILLQIKHVSCVSLTFCKARMICIALLPPPIMPIRLPSNSCLFQLVSLGDFGQRQSNCSYLSSHAAECITGIFISFRPEISGHDMSFNDPCTLMTTSALSINVSPVTQF
jgi:hypothetical protein